MCDLLSAAYGQPPAPQPGPAAPLPQGFGGPQLPAPFPAAVPTAASIRQTQVAALPPPGAPTQANARTLVAANPASVAAAARPTMAVNLNAAQQQSAAAVDALFGAEQPGWAQKTVAAQRAAANEPTAKPGQELDPRVLAMASPVPATPVPNMFPETSTASGKPLKTGVRRGRSKLAIAMWMRRSSLAVSMSEASAEAPDVR